MQSIVFQLLTPDKRGLQNIITKGESENVEFHMLAHLRIPMTKKKFFVPNKTYAGEDLKSSV